MNTAMKEDKAIIKALNRKVEPLPPGFEEELMKRVFSEAKKKSKRNFALNMALISCVSIFMLLGAFYVLKIVYSINIVEHLSFNFFSEQHKPFFIFYFYIASLILGLLWLDHAFRKLWKKTAGNH